MPQILAAALIGAVAQEARWNYSLLRYQLCSTQAASQYGTLVSVSSQVHLGCLDADSANEFSESS
jgi:hypothetical protein